MSEKVDKLISISAKNSKILGFLDGIASLELGYESKGVWIS